MNDQYHAVGTESELVSLLGYPHRHRRPACLSNGVLEQGLVGARTPERHAGHRRCEKP
jgi:hypothetical protein